MTEFSPPDNSTTSPDSPEQRWRGRERSPGIGSNHDQRAFGIDWYDG